MTLNEPPPSVVFKRAPLATLVNAPARMFCVVTIVNMSLFAGVKPLTKRRVKLPLSMRVPSSVLLSTPYWVPEAVPPISKERFAVDPNWRLPLMLSCSTGLPGVIVALLANEASLTDW